VLSCDSDDDSSSSDVEGCSDETACNYDLSVTVDDGSCINAEENYDCDGECIVDIDCNDECGGSAIEDCADICGGNTVYDECGVCDGPGMETVTVEECESGTDCGWETTSGPNAYCSSSSCNPGISCTSYEQCIHQGGFAYAGCDASSNCQYEQITEWVCDDVETCEDITYTECQYGQYEDNGCPSGRVEDCSGDGDCCLATWIGDGICDGTDQNWDCDLTCYNNDGGDCN